MNTYFDYCVYNTLVKGNPELISQLFSQELMAGNLSQSDNVEMELMPTSTQGVSIAKLKYECVSVEETCILSEKFADLTFVCFAGNWDRSTVSVIVKSAGHTEFSKEIPVGGYDFHNDNCPLYKFYPHEEMEERFLWYSAGEHGYLRYIPHDSVIEMFEEYRSDFVAPNTQNNSASGEYDELDSSEYSEDELDEGWEDNYGDELVCAEFVKIKGENTRAPIELVKRAVVPYLLQYNDDMLDTPKRIPFADEAAAQLEDLGSALWVLDSVGGVDDDIIDNAAPVVFALGRYVNENDVDNLIDSLYDLSSQGLNDWLDAAYWGLSINDSEKARKRAK